MVGCLGKNWHENKAGEDRIPYAIMVISEVETYTVPVLLKESDKLFWKQVPVELERVDLCFGSNCKCDHESTT